VKSYNSPIESAFAELEATTCLGLTGLLALYGAWVASHETFCTKGFLILGVNLYEGAGDGEAESLALSGITATEEVHLDVILLGNVEQVQRLLHDELEYGAGEVLSEVFLVDGNLTIALCYINAGYGALAAT
jgi:hypothetical protein